ncbi:MaoC family dehydratase N-terminal domain-containing protein [Burkholderia territorii]|uniref:FAS1-like dehydratase domain-containing protein n=1 Tax=Burkholderia territorii TaxID=1503055 RepID=UPI00075DBBFC|nr:MaoC family dehydratase N-terminal domain-containing protein [Burkholderia territorii]KVQ63044.1 acyl-CoA dehydrogenase [Burkholderia territorii]
MDELQSSEAGQSLCLADYIALAPAAALSATLDHPDVPQVGHPLPELWHWLYFWPVAKSSELGADGHPRKGNFLPDLGLPRRMWAGGRLHFHSLLEIGKPASRKSTILNVEEKSGRSGRLGFVTIKHELMNQKGLVIEEEQDIVYREAYTPGARAPEPAAAPTDETWQREITPTEVMLFRYSALTFNGHRIHYDKAYATREEGYSDLVVHGPLIATLLVDLVRRELPLATIKQFSFKAVRPTLLGHSFMVCGAPTADGRTIELWAKDHEGWLTMSAQAIVA